jgi:topoisomerase IV subunit B
MGGSEYKAKDIKVLEGLDPVRMRPGMYIGGKDNAALHHLIKEVFDNSMDEVISGYADRISVTLKKNNMVEIEDNGRGIPTDKHPKYKDKSALEVIMTTLHSGGKFNNKSYHTSGGLHGVGVSVVNALSEYFYVEVTRDGEVWGQEYSKGAPKTKLSKIRDLKNRRGTKTTFKPDPEIFGDKNLFSQRAIYEFIRSKAYLFSGVKIHWSCEEDEEVKNSPPQKDVIHFPNGLSDYMSTWLSEDRLLDKTFVGKAKLKSCKGEISWAIGWDRDDTHVVSYCNTIKTELGGTHEQGLRAGILRSIKKHAALTRQKKGNQITIDDVLKGAKIIVSLFIEEPEFQGQTKDKLLNKGVARPIESAVSDFFDHWLNESEDVSQALFEHIDFHLEERLSRKSSKVFSRKSVTQKLRLPGKLSDCTSQGAKGTELFIVEGDGAGGSAKQARNRANQAILPLRGKVINVVSNTIDKVSQNTEISNLEIALGCGVLKNYKESDVRYEKVIIMTDADVDGSHIATLLMAYFLTMMPELIENGHLYLAKPPLYRISQGGEVRYAKDDAEKEKILSRLSKNQKIDIGRFKGLGEMTVPQLRETAMCPETRVLIRVEMGRDLLELSEKVENLMGKKPEKRFEFIQEQALKNSDLLDGILDV